MSKIALCIKSIDAPASVIGIITGTHLIDLTEEFFYTPTELVSRDICEHSLKWLQLLPYIVLKDEDGRVFRYFRGKGGTEDRLHGKISIGVGGHVETEPEHQQLGFAASQGSLFSHLKLDACREILEETGIAVDPRDIEFVKLVYNPAGVNAYHLGILGVAKVSKAAFLALEHGVIEKGEFVDPVNDLLAEPDAFNRCEDWTQGALWYLTDAQRQAEREQVRAKLKDGKPAFMQTFSPD